MKQFDVHLNLGRNRRAAPFVMIVNSERHAAANVRVVVPLVPESEIPSPDPTLNPTLFVQSEAATESVLMDPLRIVSLPVRALGPKIDNLLDGYDKIIPALDLIFATYK